MILTIQCNRCGHWRVSESKDIDTYVFKCFKCGNEKKLKTKKGEYNLNINFHRDKKIALWSCIDKN